jgi:hypothetical protein
VNISKHQQRVQHALLVFRDVDWNAPSSEREDGVGDVGGLEWPGRMPRANRLH